MRALVLTLGVGLATQTAALTACSRKTADVAPDMSGSSIANTAVLSVKSTTLPLDASPPLIATAPSASPTTSAPRVTSGTATLVIQRVQTVCYIGTTRDTRFLGNDVLIDTLDEVGASVKPVVRESAFCPKQLQDGGKGDAKLNMWGMCKVYPSCRVLSSDAGDDRAEIQCGADHIVLESTGGSTVLHGPSGDREISPIPMKILPVVKVNRDAHVDC